MANGSKGFGGTDGSCYSDGLRCASGSSHAALPFRNASLKSANPRKDNAILGTIALPDAHCHVAFMEHPAAFTEQANAAGAAILSVTVAPEEFREMERGHAAAGPANESVRAALGLHPWWVPENEQELDTLLEGFDALLPHTQFIGEVGLDFSKRCERTRAQQLQAFRHIIGSAAGNGARALSLHCVNAYPEALHELEESGCAEQCGCIFHWFSGSSQELTRAIDLGCWFSVGERMLQTKRGREYAKAIPLNRLLLETDAPRAESPEIHRPAVPYTFTEHQAELSRALGGLAELQRTPSESLAATIRENAQKLLG